MSTHLHDDLLRWQHQQQRSSPLAPALSPWRVYQRLLLHAWLSDYYARLRGRQRGLPLLAAALAGQRVAGSHALGVRTIPLEQVVGSEARCADFDSHFRPLHSTSWPRWQSLARAWQTGVVLPPVELVQVGAGYYVRDGHHRISVARAFGQADIDALVTVVVLAAG